jgi:hypothetical protein
MRRHIQNTAHAIEKLGVKRGTASANLLRKSTKKPKDRNDVKCGELRGLRESGLLQQTLPA